MSLVLTKRASNGSPLTAIQHDANMTAIESAVNTNTTDVATRALSSTVTNAFSGFGGLGGLRGQVEWSNVIGTPQDFTRELFKASKTDANQQVTATGGFVVNFPTEHFDYGNRYNTSTQAFTAGFAGVYSLGTSVQVGLDSGSPTAVSIVISLRVNGSPIEQVTLDNTGTGIRIYKISTLHKLSASDAVDVYADFTFSGTATWQVEANNTNFWGEFRYAHA